MSEPTVIEPAPVPERAVVVKPVGQNLFWIVSGVLVACLIASYVLLDSSVKQTRADLGLALENASNAQKELTNRSVAEIREATTKELAKMQDENKKLEIEKEELKVLVASLRKDHVELAKNFTDVSTKQGKIITDTSDDLSLTKQSVQKVEVKVGYLDQRVTKIEGRLTNLDNDISKLNEGSATLKAELKHEQEALRQEVAAVGKKGNVTEDELRKLESKALAFELKVLNERAKQAADAARQNDYKKTLQLLDFKD